jgi:hypothetical protein
VALTPVDQERSRHIDAMLELPRKRRVTWPLWLGIGSIPIVLGLIIWTGIQDKSHEEAFAAVKVGSSPQSLGNILSRQDIMHIWYADWVPVDASKLERPILYTKHGHFYRMPSVLDASLHDIESLDAKFSGQVNCRIDRAFQDDVGMSFTFVDGRLVEKGLGIFPG